MPKEVIVETAQGAVRKAVESIGPDDVIVDVGPESITELGMYIEKAHTILWNGPLGLYEKGYTKSTEETARLIADAHAHSIVGGGDTAAEIRALKLEDKMGFISTGGGAMLDYLVDGVLPAVEALKSKD